MFIVEGGVFRVSGEEGNCDYFVCVLVFFECLGIDIE